jgi:hypothetical protein
VAQAASFGRFLAFGGPGSATATRPARDARIDVIRGLALLFIFVNHMPGNVVAGFMPHNFGFSDAADAFVLLAGVSATLAYGGLIDRDGAFAGARKVATRVWTLYLAHLAVFVLVCAIVATAVTKTQNPLYIEALNVQPLFGRPLQTAIDTLMLRYQPNYLDILPLYIVLLALFPAIYLGMRFSPLLTLAASLALWLSTRAFGLNLPNAGAGGWFFNPFAWQLIFVLGMMIGRAAQLGLRAPRLRLLDAAALGVLLFALAVKTSSGNPFGIALLNDWIDKVQLGTDKTNLAFERVAHVLALGWLAIRYLPSGGAMLASRAGRLLAHSGRHSLEVFCAGIVLSISGQIIMAETGFALGVQLLIAAAGAMVLLGLGVFLSWFKASHHHRAADADLPLPGISPQRF